MDVEWTVALSATGRATVAPTRSDHAAYRKQLDALLDHRSGSSEVSRAGLVYPKLTLSVNGDLAVVHRFDDAETCLLLEGSGLVSADETYDFPTHNEFVPFTGEFISTAVRAAEILFAFAQGSDIGDLGIWVRP